MRALLPFAIAVGLLCVSPSICQKIAIKKSETRSYNPAGTVQIHQIFFERVANYNPRQPFAFRSDLTDTEMTILTNAATDCATKLHALDDRPVVLEARMRFVESGDEQEKWLGPRLERLKALRDQVVVDHVEALRASLGEPRFQILEAAIHGWYNSLTVVTAPVAGTAPVKKY